MIWIVSWRNVWRNKLRSSLVILAITLGILAGVFTVSFYKGMAVQRVKTVINTETSHIQIHNKSYMLNNDPIYYINNINEIIRTIKKIPEVKAVSKRLVSFSMCATAENVTGVKVTGIEPDNEIKLSDINTKIIKGSYFNGVPRNPIIIGNKLAHELKVKVGSKIVITFQDINGDIISEAFRIAGIFKTNNTIFDKTNVFVRFSDLKRIINFPDNTSHEIAVKLNDIDNTNVVKRKLTSKFNKLDISTWDELKPELAYMSDITNFYMYIFVVIILLALCFGIINTMLMAVLERVKEIGMLMAIGMNKIKIFFMIMLETIFLTVTGGILGLITGYFISKYFETTPINLSMYSKALSNFGYDSLVYTEINIKMIIIITIMIIITGIIAAIYPAIKALSNKPVEALKTE